MLDAALDLAAAGWAVFPCRWSGEHAKAPLTGHGHHDATRDLDVIRSWWQRWPLAMIGAPVPESLLVVDLDPRNGGRVDALTEAAGPLPETLTVWSGRGDGGRHWYYLRPPGQLTSTRLPAGVDLKVHGYCIMPPSLHPASGQPYRWEHRPAAALPVGLRALLRPPPPARFTRPGGHAAGNGAALVAFVARFTDDGVNNALYWAARRAAENGLLDNLEDELVAVAVRVGESEHRARRTVDSARKATGGLR